MAEPHEDHHGAPLPPAEKRERWPAWCAGALAVGHTGWMFLAEEARPLHDAQRVSAWTQTWLRPPSVPHAVAAALAGATVMVVFWFFRRSRGARTGLGAALVWAVLLTGAEAVWNANGALCDPLDAVRFFLLVTAGWRLVCFADDSSVANGLVAGLCLGAMPAFSVVGTVLGALLAARWLWRVRPMARSWPVAAGAVGILLWLACGRG